MIIFDKNENNGEVIYNVMLEEDVFVDVKCVGDLCYVMDCEDGYVAYNCDGNTFAYDFNEDEVVAFVKNIYNNSKNCNKKYTIRLNFFWDEGDDMEEFNLFVPEETTIDEIQETLIKMHNYLCNDDTSGVYDVDGCNPETLLEYTCLNYGWMWNELEFDLDLNFD